jgi:capsular polysaccharide biosynthesis protein
MKTIFYLEGRGGNYLYHFFIFNLGGLYYIEKKQYNIRGKQNTSVLLEDKRKIVPIPTTQICYPIKIHMKNLIPFQRETFTILKDKFELIEDLSTIKYDYEIVSIYGENNIEEPKYNICPFLRNLFLEQINFEMKKDKRIFITRKDNEKYHGDLLKRYIYNENELMLCLKKYNFEYIQLEDLSMYEKIKLFMESKIIVSSHSSALTLTLFSNKSAKIIEILNKGTRGFPHSQFMEISKVLDLQYHRYSNIKEDYNGNFNLNVNDFEKYLIPLL